MLDIILNMQEKLNELININNKIDELCKVYNFCGDDLIPNIDKISAEDNDKLIILLEKKLKLQKEIYILQGRNLDNVIFLNNYK